jgi:hypothetical protein
MFGLSDWTLLEFMKILFQLRSPLKILFLDLVTKHIFEIFVSVRRYLSQFFLSWHLKSAFSNKELKKTHYCKMIH